MNDRNSGAKSALKHVATKVADTQLRRIEEQLRAQWGSVVEEPLPGQIIRLLDTLERAERDRNPSAKGH